MFCTIDSIATGLDITRARTVFWLQMEWTAALFTQAEGRIRRLSSQYEYVQSVVLSGLQYWDQRIMRLVSDKQKLTDWLLD